jgi:hypothetical protein
MSIKSRKAYKQYLCDLGWRQDDENDWRCGRCKTLKDMSICNVCDRCEFCFDCSVELDV